MINTTKLHKIFNDGTITRAKDAWWDTNALCRIMKANQGMAFDSNLIFPEVLININIPGMATPAETIEKSRTTYCQLV